MADKNLKEHLAEYYGARSLPESVALCLEQAARPSERSGQGRPSPRSTRMDVRTKALVACVLALVLLALGLLRQVNRLEDDLADRSRQAPAAVPSPGVGNDHAPANPGARDARLASADPPNLVAMFVHADWCPRCPIVGPIYGEIAEKYAAEDVLFVKLDTTDRRTQNQMSLLADVLDIKWVPRNQRQSGMITLIDRDTKTVLATLTGRNQLRDLEEKLNEVLERTPE